MLYHQIMSNEAWLNAEIGFALYLLRAGKLEAARDGLFALEAPSGPQALAAFNELGAALFAGERYFDAQTAFAKALAIAPDDGEAALGRCYALFNQGRLREAAQGFKTLAERPGLGAAPWRGAAAAYLNLYDFGQTAECLRQAVGADPHDAESLALIGLSVFRRAKADHLWREWTRRNLKDAKERPDLLAASISSRDLDEALQALADARRINPEIRTEELATRLLTVSGRPEAALDFLAATPSPSGKTYQLMADVCWLLRDPKAAKRYLRQSFEARDGGEKRTRPLGQDIEGLPAVAQGLRLRKTCRRDATPLVWLHWDAPDYFALSVASALAASPATPLAILGDAANVFQACQHAPMVKYAASAWEFLERYAHASENDFVYEAFCLMRWFILRDWALVANHERVVSIDSDILLAADLEGEILPSLGARKYGFAGATGPHFSALTQDGLDDFCGYLLAAYRNGAPDIGGQITDMTLLPRFLAGRDWADFSAPAGGARIDGNMRLSEGCRMAAGLKEVSVQDGRAYAAREGDGAPTRLLALHYQGPSKPQMREMFLRLNPP